MKSITTILSIVALGSLGYATYQQVQVGALKEECTEAQGKALRAEAEAMRQRDIAEQQRLAAEMAAVEARKAIELVAECEKRRR